MVLKTKNITAILAKAIQPLDFYTFFSVHFCNNFGDMGTLDILYIENSKKDT